MSRDAQLITESWAAIEPRAAWVARVFYARIFHDHPDTRDMFPVMMDVQRDRMLRALIRIVQELTSPERLAPYLAQLGRDHRKFGVEPAHYALVGEALIETLRECGGPAWTPEVEAAWERALGKVATIMVDAASRVVGEPPWWDAVVTAHELRAPELAVLTLRLDQPMAYLAGQYVTVQTPRRARLWRQYSIANAPRPDGTLELHVRAVPGGWVSRALVHHTGPGDRLRVGSPAGLMVADMASGRDVVCVAGGTGLAPLRAIVEEMARWNADRQVTVFVGARLEDELYDLGALERLAQAHKWLRVAPVVGEPVPDAFAAGGAWDNHEVYVAGPPQMIRRTLERCRELGVPPARVRYDGLAAAGFAAAETVGPVGPAGLVPIGATGAG
jgi:NAD(P)H-flavin reductase/hemoglobin-like flavoprotein